MTLLYVCMMFDHGTKILAVMYIYIYIYTYTDTYINMHIYTYIILYNFTWFHTLLLISHYVPVLSPEYLHCTLYIVPPLSIPAKWLGLRLKAQFKCESHHFCWLSHQFCWLSHSPRQEHGKGFQHRKPKRDWADERLILSEPQPSSSVWLFDMIYCYAISLLNAPISGYCRVL